MVREAIKKENSGVTVSVKGPLKPYPESGIPDSYLGICGIQNCGNVISFQINKGIMSTESVCTKCGATNTQ